MTSWVDELDSAWELALDAHEKLEEKDPNHELLKYLDPKLQKALNWEEIKERFWDKSRGPWEGQNMIIVQTVVLSNYFFALEKALVEAPPVSEEEAGGCEIKTSEQSEDVHIPF